MQTQIKAWGNSQAIRLSKELLETAGMKINDTVEVKASRGKIVINGRPQHLTLRERAEAYGGKLNIGGEIDYGEPVGREVW